MSDCSEMIGPAKYQVEWEEAYVCYSCMYFRWAEEQPPGDRPQIATCLQTDRTVTEAGKSFTPHWCPFWENVFAVQRENRRRMAREMLSELQDTPTANYTVGRELQAVLAEALKAYLGEEDPCPQPR